MATCKACGQLIMEPYKAHGWHGPICHCGFGQPITWEDQKTIDEEMDIPPPELPEHE